MKKLLCSMGLFLLAASLLAQPHHEYRIVKAYPIHSTGWWDYIAVNDGKLYVSHGTQVNILDEFTGDSLGLIPHTTGVHGIVFDTALNRGYTSNGRLNNVTIFNLSTNKVIGNVRTGENPDAIKYEPYSKTIITCNGGSKDLSVIDPKTNKVIATVPVGGKPETAVSDNEGKLYVNVEDKSEIAVVNTKTFKVENRWPIAPGEAPSGLAMDTKTKRLFAGCDNKLLMVINATNGKVVAQLPIGDGCDGVVFDRNRNIIFTSNGEGSLTAIQENGPTHFSVMGNFKTKRGARTIALDEKTGTLFLPTADFEATNNASGRSNIIPGTFQVLVVQ